MKWLVEVGYIEGPDKPENVDKIGFTTNHC